MTDFSAMKMACLGDSLTMGQGIETPYSVLVKQELGLLDAYNYGIGWSTVADGGHCRCHPENFALGHNPFIDRYHLMKPADIIAVCGGANDRGVNIALGEIHDTDRSTFCGALHILITGLKKTFPDAYLFFMTPFCYDKTTDNGVHMSAFADAVMHMCEIHGIDCCDCYHGIPFDAAADTTDGVHPTQKFVSEVWAPYIAQFIRNHIS